MTERIPKSVLVAGAIATPFMLAFLAYSQPEYFTSETYIKGLILLEFLFVATWKYRQVFFPVVLVAFLFAGTGLAVGGGWAAARWVILGVAAAVGCLIMLKDQRHHFGLFHTFALFAALAALASAAVSRYPIAAVLKALSLLLLLVYGATGVRVAVAGRENRFFNGLLIGVEVFVGVIAASYLLGREVMGNPNSLGAVMGVVGVPILLWGMLLGEKPYVQQRRFVLFAIAMFLVFHSHSRASMAAAFLSCGLLCLALRKYRLLAQGVVVIVILVGTTAIFNPDVFSRTVSSATSSFVYKSDDPTRGLLASRESPWQAATATIRSHFWFGTGFGTTDSGQDASAHLDQFSTVGGIATENGSSYLEIFMWVGLLGLLPFVFLLVSIMSKVFRTVLWMYHSENPCHPAVPLAMVMVAGLVHAAFEDWLFAPGYYLCVFFWSLAFILVDVAPATSLPRFGFAWRPSRMQANLRGVAPSR